MAGKPSVHRKVVWTLRCVAGVLLLVSALLSGIGAQNPIRPLTAIGMITMTIGGGCFLFEAGRQFGVDRAPDSR